jgi:hypothetical protein
VVNGVKAVKDKVRVQLGLKSVQLKVHHGLPPVNFLYGITPDPFFPVEKIVADKRYA